LVSFNLFQFILAVVLHSAALCIRLRNILRKWFVTAGLTLPHDLQPHRIFTDFLWWFRSNSFAYFSSLPRRSNISIRNTLETINKSYSFTENDL